MSRYREAGVDIEKATRAMASISKLADATRATSNASIGHFGGTHLLSAGPDRLLVASADGVGTKLRLAVVLGGNAHAQVGADLVNHCVNDILACGATPLFFLDYFAMGSLESDLLELVVSGISRACVENGLALIGGETAEMPGLYSAGDYDVAGFIVGEVAPDRYLDGSRVETGNVLLGWESIGLHTNGYSLARKTAGVGDSGAVDRERLDLPLPTAETMSIAGALMSPHPSYLEEVRPLLDEERVNGLAHITGGGLVGNVPRMLPDGMAAAFDLAAWKVPPVIEWLVEEADLSADERYRVFNMGLGMVAAVDAGDVDEALRLSPGALVVGEVVEAGEDVNRRVFGLG